MEISHLLFADDTILLCGASSEILRAIRRVLLCFEVVFRMKVNLGKRKIVPLARWERWGGRWTGSLQMTYLGFLLGSLLKLG
jgi:hypothetical protein